ncbi:hypothetical protein COHA_001387 [Chlorella ohadii]|uniref:Poly [ADP-ribose] polymerase n=1 Tax=Chlorella ohadii TaxID=2649997 RepID=A0AAD5DXT7_9CHLO|nr:hypothetical protein COHA_001387 [Chlorella ohadii]
MAQELQSILDTADPWAADLLLSALAAAAASYRRATCTVPFPSPLFGDGDARDYAALLQNLQALPPLGAPGAAARLSAQQLSLVSWLLTHPRRPVASMRRCTLRQVQEQLPSLTGWVADIGMNPSLRPTAVLQLSAVPPSVGSSRVLAFHGTSFENLHSILHHGLLNASGTRLERTGSAFGKGIYFSSELAVAYAFCQPAEGWAGSALGRRLRCLLVCSIEREAIQSSHNSDLVPDKYLVVEAMDAVQTHFVFVYCDDAPPGSPPPPAHHPAHRQQLQHPPAARVAAPAQRHGVSPLVWVLAAFTLLLLAVGLRDNPSLRRFVRRQLGLRIL